MPKYWADGGMHCWDSELGGRLSSNPQGYPQKMRLLEHSSRRWLRHQSSSLYCSNSELLKSRFGLFHVSSEFIATMV